MVRKENRLSIFVDESGDFGFKGQASRWYVFSMVFHSQSDLINQSLNALERKLRELGFPEHCIHTGPIIRREQDYVHCDLKLRRDLMFAMRHFVRNVPVKVKTFIFDKNQWPSKDKLQARIAKQLAMFLSENLERFQAYESIVLYYDNGQSELGSVLNTTLNTLLDVEAKREVKPAQYRLFQLADYVCTLELIAHKKIHHQLTKSESVFFKGNELEKQFMREIRKQQFNYLLPYHRPVHPNR